MRSPLVPIALLLSLLSLLTPAFADTPAAPAPDAAFQNWLYKTPSAIWKRSESNGNLVFSTPLPPGDFCTLTLFAGTPTDGMIATQFAAAVDADQKKQGALKIEADSQPQFGIAPEGYPTVFRTMRSETNALHTYNFYIAGQNKSQFALAAFQTTSDETWKKYGPEATQFLHSLKLANALPPDQVAKLIHKPADDAPMLPGFGADQTAMPAQPAAPAPPNTPAAAQPHTNLPDVPVDKSPLVNNHALVQRNGKPVDALKLSQHDLNVVSPSIAVAPDGTIHVAFIEQHKTTFAYAVYHRSSTDGGKTWSEAKNLSESMTGLTTGRCQVLVDSKNRAYIIWRAALSQYSPASAEPSSRGAPTNIVYRTLQSGAWSKIINISAPADATTQPNGALCSFAALDAAGHVQVLWNVNPDKWHPENMYERTQHQAGIGNGLIFQSTLDGTSASAPREVYLSPLKLIPRNIGDPTPCADGLDDLNGYADAAGNAHFVALADNYIAPYAGHSHVQFIENGKPGAAFDLPDLSFHAWSDEPTLLLDAAGKKHVICLYPAGEHPCIQDYLLGSDDEPTVIRQAADVKGTANAMQAFQGPNGHMIVLMQMNDDGNRDGGDSYLSTSTGHGWSAPINLTNNAARSKFAASQHGAAGVAISTTYGPGPTAAAYTPDGHLALLMIVYEKSLFGTSSFGVTMAGGSTSTPTLCFLKL